MIPTISFGTLLSIFLWGCATGALGMFIGLWIFSCWAERKKNAAQQQQKGAP